MEDYKQDIETMESRIRDNIEAIDRQTMTVGEAVAELPVQTVAGTVFEERVGRIAELSATVAEKKKTIELWREIEQEIADIGLSLKQADAEIAGKRREVEPVFESVGEAALELYQSNPTAYPELETALDGLMSIEQGIREKERALQQLESSSKQESFFAKTLAKGKEFVIRGSLKTRGFQKNRNLREAGEAICEGEFPKVPESSRLAKELAPVRAAKQEIQTLERRKEKLFEQQQKAEERKVAVEKQERMRNPAANLEHEVERLEAQIRDLKRDLGREYLKAGDRPGDADQRIEDAAAAVERYEKKNEELSRLKERLEAAREVERISEEISTHEGRKAELQNRIKALDDGIEKLGGALELQKKTRGSVQSLAKAVAEETGQSGADDALVAE